MPAAKTHIIRQFQNGVWTNSSTDIVSESQVTLTVNGMEWLAFSCTPDLLPELSVGFLFNEGIITHNSEIQSVQATCQDTNVDVWLNRTVEKPKLYTRTSGCTGGNTSVTTDQTHHKTPHQMTISSTMLFSGIEQLFNAQDQYQKTRGIHCSILYDGESVLYSAEDIGRHNTLDKLAGLMVFAEHPLPNRRLVFTTGRVSSEMAQKSARMGAQVIASLTTPTSQAVSVCDQLGITLVGYLRQGKFTAYTHYSDITG